MDIRIEPLDTLFFRDGKPFTMGEETWADSHLLPSPSVIYGALRTAVATQNGIAFEAIANKTKLNSEDFFIKSLYYRINDSNTLPLPLDLVEYEKEINIVKAESEEKKYEVKPLVIKPNASVFSNSKNKIKYFLIAKNLEQVEAIDNGLIIISEFEKYLANDLDSTYVYKLTDFILNESKIGIGRDDSTKTSDEGSLFRTDMKRGKDFEIAVNFELNNYSDIASLVRLGGEGKIATISTITRRPLKIANRIVDFKNNRFKIYFATPAILTNGEPDLSKLKLDFNATLVTACVGKPVSIGGFDMDKRQAKKMYKMIPAGSVFYYEADTDVSLLNEKQGNSLSDEMPEQGFGIAYFGNWNK